MRQITIESPAYRIHYTHIYNFKLRQTSFMIHFNSLIRYRKTVSLIDGNQYNEHQHL